MTTIPQDHRISAFVPASVRRLDALLNDRVATASTDRDQAEWFRLKVSIKRRLVALLDTEIESAAAAMLRELKLPDAA